MKFLILATIVSLAVADVSHILNKDEKNAQILRQEQDISPDGSYQWSLETDNGIAADEVGTIKFLGEDQVAKTVQGQNSWTSPEGQKVQIAYVADENGYQPQGDVLPTPPPIPVAIQRLLEFLKANPPQVVQGQN